MKFSLSFAILLFTFISSFSQQNACIYGFVVNENNVPLANASLQLLHIQKGTISNNNGSFSLSVPAGKAIALVISYAGYQTVQKNFFLKKGDTAKITVQLSTKITQLADVTVKEDKGRKEIGRINIDASNSLVNPSPISGIESLIKVIVGSNNELTSQYNVRGGSYDENLMYVNDFEVYRPYLVRSGQQEGLSFINPELTGNVKFYNGGFAAKYGDKMSSTLDITYRKPKNQSGSAYLGLLEQGIHLEGSSTKHKTTYLIGARNRSNRNLLSSQDTKGNYIPSSADLQALITYQASAKWMLELLANTSTTKFTFFPEESKLTSSVFTPFYSANLGLDIYFQGQERDAYTTRFLGASATYQPAKNLKLKWMLSYFGNSEQENVDITGAYLFGDRNFDKSSSSYGLITNPLGAGVYQNYSRNKLTIDVWNATLKGSYDHGNHAIQWGNSIDRYTISDKLNEWQYNDSAGYSLPYTITHLPLYSVLKSRLHLNITRFSGYVQDNVQLKNNTDAVLQMGVRYNYNTLNNELLVSPRLGIAFKPRSWKRDAIIKASAGVYQQPPFYRELRRYDGSVNTALKAQKSWQLSTGIDYNFALFQRPAKLTTEMYYKNMTDVVPYDVDNVRIRYFGQNQAKAYAVGWETRLYGELVKDAESWVSFGLMRTQEKIANFSYQQYKNAAGEIIKANTTDQVIADSVTTQVGWVRRPTDRLVTFGMFFQDYLSTNKNIKFYLNALYGSNLPYNIPGSVKYRNALTIDPYLRIDMGFSALLLDAAKKQHRSHSPFKDVQSIWASFEIFNLIDRANTISYLLIKDFSNNTYTMPNRLTSRLVNVKLVVRW